MLDGRKFEFGSICCAVILVLALCPAIWAALTGDFTGDGNVDMEDYSVLASYWQDDACGICGGADLSGDNGVDMSDLALFRTYWLDKEVRYELSASFLSIDDDDGRVWDYDDSGAGYGTNDSAELRLGDWYQTGHYYGYKNILSFDIQGLPADADITAATVQMTRDSGEGGANPFVWAGTCAVDIANPYFGSSASLANEDWQTDPNAAGIASFAADPGPEGVMESTGFSSAGLSHINVGGKTQLRVYFTDVTNADPNSDYLDFYAGETSAKAPKLLLTYTTAEAPVAIFESIAGDDGRVYDRDDDPNVGSGIDVSGLLRLGDYYGSGYQYAYRNVLSFDTSSLADATIISAKLQLRRNALAGAGVDPFNWGGECAVDIAMPYFGDAVGLEAIDWQADPNAASIATFAADPGPGNWMESAEFSDLSYINKDGKTQLRVYFTIPRNDDTESDYLEFYSGNSSGNEPKLVVEYLP